MSTLVLIWRAAGLLLASEARSVIEALPPVASRPMPGAPEWVRGLFVHRGDLIPLIDAARLLSGLSSVSAEPSADLLRNRVLALRISGADDRSEWRVGLWVESLLDLERIDFAGSGTHPGLSTDAARFLGPVAQTRFGFVQLVRPDELLTAEQSDLLSRRISEEAA